MNKLIELSLANPKFLFTCTAVCTCNQLCTSPSLSTEGRRQKDMETRKRETHITQNESLRL